MYLECDTSDALETGSAACDSDAVSEEILGSDVSDAESAVVVVNHINVILLVGNVSTIQ